MYLSFFSITKLLNNLSIISALVATVPRPPVSPIISFNSLSASFLNFTSFYIADSNVASVNLEGGLVSPIVFFIEETNISLPTLSLFNSSTG